jgi:hypothetical protein
MIKVKRLYSHAVLPISKETYANEDNTNINKVRACNNLY